MALRDSWHSALVYFGLAEDYHEELDEAPETELEDRYRDRPNVRRLRRRRDEFDEIFADDEPRSGRSTTVLKSVGTRGNGDARVHLVLHKSFSGAPQIAARCKDAIRVVL